MTRTVEKPFSTLRKPLQKLQSPPTSTPQRLRRRNLRQTQEASRVPPFPKFELNRFTTRLRKPKKRKKPLLRARAPMRAVSQMTRAPHVTVIVRARASRDRSCARALLKIKRARGRSLCARAGCRLYGATARKTSTEHNRETDPGNYLLSLFLSATQ